MTCVNLVLVFLTLWTLSVAEEKGNTVSTTTTTTTTTTSGVNMSISPEVHKHNSSRSNVRPSGLSLDSHMIQRALYVLIGITLIGVLYFIVRAVRVKKSTVPRRKYGLLADYDDTMEMSHLESDEDDTVYEARAVRR